MKSNHRLQFIMYFNAGILNVALLFIILNLDLEHSTWLLVMYPLLTIIWFASAFVHWRRMKRNES